jgi:hypothetical protein
MMKYYFLAPSKPEKKFLIKPQRTENALSSVRGLTGPVFCAAPPPDGACGAA